MNNLSRLKLKLKGLTIFTEIKKNQVVKLLVNLLESDKENIEDLVENYGEFTHSLFLEKENLTEYIWNLILYNENIYLKKKSRNEMISEMLDKTLKEELKTLEELSKINSKEIKGLIDEDIFLPEWETSEEMNFILMYSERMKNIKSLGYGIYSDNTMFTYNNGQVVPVKVCDNTRLKSLTGYEWERKSVVDNTRAFIKNKPAANVLLYGDAGTGKSSTVKAVVNEFSKEGLRMIEVRKGQLLEIPNLIEELSTNPLKFILFIDDLSFSKYNEEIGTLKAILEGSVSGKTSNVVIYATSNRRHLVKESFSDRSEDDIHINETIQEQTSLSDRFGLSICFSKPSKKEYLDIVYGLLKDYEVENVKDIDILAERHALRRGGRSGRTARQFVEGLKSQED